MIIYADFLGVFVAALSGALLAARKEMDIYGFLVLGLITGIGGGTLRDIILDVPVFWVQNQAYIVIGLLAGALAFLFARQAMNGWRQRAILWLDAAAMAFFAATGAAKSIGLDAGGLVVVVMAFMTATAGGLMRDTIANETPFIFSGEVYATAAIFGGVIAVLAHAMGIENLWLIPLAWLGAFGLRAVAIGFNWRFSVRKRADDGD